MVGRCEARTGRDEGGHRCQLQAKHAHADHEGRQIHVCKGHYRMLRRLAREDLDAEVIERWLEANSS